MNLGSDDDDGLVLGTECVSSSAIKKTTVEKTEPVIQNVRLSNHSSSSLVTGFLEEGSPIAKDSPFHITEYGAFNRSNVNDNTTNKPSTSSNSGSNSSGSNSTSGDGGGSGEDSTAADAWSGNETNASVDSRNATTRASIDSRNSTTRASIDLRNVSRTFFDSSRASVFANETHHAMQTTSKDDKTTSKEDDYWKTISKDGKTTSKDGDDKTMSSKGSLLISSTTSEFDMNEIDIMNGSDGNGRCGGAMLSSNCDSSDDKILKELNLGIQKNLRTGSSFDQVLEQVKGKNSSSPRSREKFTTRGSSTTTTTTTTTTTIIPPGDMMNDNNDNIDNNIMKTDYYNNGSIPLTSSGLSSSGLSSSGLPSSGLSLGMDFKVISNDILKLNPTVFEIEIGNICSESVFFFALGSVLINENQNNKNFIEKSVEKVIVFAKSRNITFENLFETDNRNITFENFIQDSTKNNHGREMNHRDMNHREMNDRDMNDSENRKYNDYDDDNHNNNNDRNDDNNEWNHLIGSVCSVSYNSIFPIDEIMELLCRKTKFHLITSMIHERKSLLKELEILETRFQIGFPEKELSQRIHQRIQIPPLPKEGADDEILETLFFQSLYPLIMATEFVEKLFKGGIDGAIFKNGLENFRMLIVAGNGKNVSSSSLSSHSSTTSSGKNINNIFHGIDGVNGSATMNNNDDNCNTTNAEFYGGFVYYRILKVLEKIYGVQEAPKRILHVENIAEIYDNIYDSSYHNILQEKQETSNNNGFLNVDSFNYSSEQQFSHILCVGNGAWICNDWIDYVRGLNQKEVAEDHFLVKVSGDENSEHDEQKEEETEIISFLEYYAQKNAAIKNSMMMNNNSMSMMMNNMSNNGMMMTRTDVVDNLDHHDLNDSNNSISSHNVIKSLSCHNDIMIDNRRHEEVVEHVQHCDVLEHVHCCDYYRRDQEGKDSLRKVIVDMSSSNLPILSLLKTEGNLIIIIDDKISNNIKNQKSNDQFSLSPSEAAILIAKGGNIEFHRPFIRLIENSNNASILVNLIPQLLVNASELWLDEMQTLRRRIVEDQKIHIQSNQVFAKLVYHGVLS